MYRNLAQKQKNPWRTRTHHSKKRESHWKKSRYAQYIDDMRTNDWKNFLKKISQFKDDMSSIHVNNPANNLEVVNGFVNLIKIITKFCDDGLLSCVPAEKSEIISEFYDTLSITVRREKTPVSYWNSTKPNEEVTYENLYIASSEPVTEKEIKNRKIPRILIKRYNDKLYLVDAPMSSISKWLKGNVKTVTGQQCMLSASKTYNMFSVIRSELTDICNKVLA